MFSLATNEFQHENKVLISGLRLLDDITSCLRMKLPAVKKHHERYSADCMKQV